MVHNLAGILKKGGEALSKTLFCTDRHDFGQGCPVPLPPESFPSWAEEIQKHNMTGREKEKRK